MRLVLKQGTREILLFSRNRFVQFDSPRSAGDFLARYLLEADNLERLRAALHDSGEFAWLARRDDVTVLDRVSELMSQGIMRLISDPDNLTPWAWRFDSPSFPQVNAGAAFESEALVQDDDESDEQENEVEDPIPEPVLPPVFIIVAEQEASTIFGENRLYELVLDMLRFVGLAGEGESEVAPAYTEVQARQNTAVEAITDEYVAGLDPLAAGGLDPQGPSALAQIYPVLVTDQQTSIQYEAEGAAEVLTDLTAAGFDGAPESGVAPGLVTEAKVQIAAVRQTTKEAADTLALLSSPDMPSLPAATVAESLRTNALHQADQLNPLVTPTAEALGDMALVNGEAPPAGTVMEHLRLSGAANGQKVVDITASASDAVGAVATAPDGPIVNADSQVSIAHLTQAGAHEAVLIDRANGAGVGLSALCVDPNLGNGGGGPAGGGLGDPDGDDAASDEADPDAEPTGDGSVEAAGWMLGADDPRGGVLETVTVGPVFFGAKLVEPGLVKLDIHDAAATAEPGEPAPKPLTRFSVATDDDGMVLVPYNLSRLPDTVRSVRVEIRTGRDPDVRFESQVPLVRRLAFGDARITIDTSVPAVG